VGGGDGNVETGRVDPNVGSVVDDSGTDWGVDTDVKGAVNSGSIVAEDVASVGGFPPALPDDRHAVALIASTDAAQNAAQKRENLRVRTRIDLIVRSTEVLAFNRRPPSLANGDALGNGPCAEPQVSLYATVLAIAALTLRVGASVPGGIG
jgi:hypothetical protein